MTELVNSLDIQTEQEPVKNCQRCSLRKTCNQVVPGIGPKKASLMIIGEAPGYDEDLVGEPFIGQCGQLLTKLLTAAGISREDAYITNTVKCRPPGNSKPSPAYIAACKPWLWGEIQEVSPKVILPLGKVPTQLLLKLKASFKMGDVIGKEHAVTYTEAVIMPWYHPSYLLRQGKTADKDTIDFFKKIKEKSNGLELETIHT